MPLCHCVLRPAESVTQLFAQYGQVAMVRICSRGSTGKLPSWLNKAVEAINMGVGNGEFALVEFASEDECVHCVTKTKNPDNWWVPVLQSTAGSSVVRSAIKCCEKCDHHAQLLLSFSQRLLHMGPVPTQLLNGHTATAAHSPHPCTSIAPNTRACSHGVETRASVACADN
jgi:hypothetical protein